MIDVVLPRTTAKEIRSKSHRVSRLSPVHAEMRLPKPLRNLRVEDPRTPVVSTATGSKTYLRLISRYLWRFSASRRSAAAPGVMAVSKTAEAQKVSAQVESQHKLIPRA